MATGAGTDRPQHRCTPAAHLLYTMPHRQLYPPYTVWYSLASGTFWPNLLYTVVHPYPWPPNRAKPSVHRWYLRGMYTCCTLWTGTLVYVGLAIPATLGLQGPWYRLFPAVHC